MQRKKRLPTSKKNKSRNRKTIKAERITVNLPKSRPKSDGKQERKDKEVRGQVQQVQQPNSRSSRKSGQRKQRREIIYEIIQENFLDLKDMSFQTVWIYWYPPNERKQIHTKAIHCKISECWGQRGGSYILFSSTNLVELVNSLNYALLQFNKYFSSTYFVQRTRIQGSHLSFKNHKGSRQINQKLWGWGPGTGKFQKFSR